MKRRDFIRAAAGAPLALFGAATPSLGRERERVFQRLRSDGLHIVDPTELRAGDFFTMIDMPLDDATIARGHILYLANSDWRTDSDDIIAAQVHVLTGKYTHVFQFRPPKGYLSRDRVLGMETEDPER